MVEGGLVVEVGLVEMGLVVEGGLVVEVGLVEVGVVVEGGVVVGGEEEVGVGSMRGALPNLDG